MALRVTVGATDEPLSLNDAKDHLRVSSTDEDVLVESQIRAAREWVENRTRRALPTQTFQLTADAFPRARYIELPRSPLVAATTSYSPSVTYLPSTGGTATLSSTAYIVDAESEPGRIVLKDAQSWPSVTLQAANGVRVSFKAGYGASSDVPQGLKQAMQLLVGHYYENREGVVVGSISTNVDMTVNSLVAGFRVPDVP